MVEVPPALLYEYHPREGVSGAPVSRFCLSCPGYEGEQSLLVLSHCQVWVRLDEVWVRLEIAILTLMTRTITPLTCEFLSIHVHVDPALKTLSVVVSQEH